MLPSASSSVALVHAGMGVRLHACLHERIHVPLNALTHFCDEGVRSRQTFPAGPKDSLRRSDLRTPGAGPIKQCSGSDGGLRTIDGRITAVCCAEL